ncbi:hypothetical protein ACSAGD_06620 [Paramicrobacterium sp. CJ85]|uniref:PH-like domain-containing protein n=1 Tax=Paramicrobacterium sp. CJ85 TaxID=3445355 RepID=UPI003F63A86D
MDKLIPGLIVAAIIAVLLALMWNAWRRRRTADAAHAAEPVPGSYAPTREFDVQYVATTRAGQPLERLALPGLGFRGPASLGVASTGIRLEVRGERAAFIPASAVRDVDTSRVAIDRVVERDGLVRIGWTVPDGTACDSYVRLREPSEQPRALEALTALRTTDQASTASDSESTA